ncbi:MAG: cyclase family protein [Lachnospiraceae bacterium]|nr:cyclase family protein [Lachnospiraceae bacterium]
MSRTIDLTHILDPKKAQRKFQVETIGADEVNHNVVRMEGQWYIMSDIHMVSHIGTHIEVPYHLFKDAYDLAQMPIDAYYGDACVLDFSGIQERVPITLEIAKEAAEKAGGIRKGDIVLCNLGFADRYGTPEYGNSPYFSTEAIEYLATSGMKMMGVDAGGVEIPMSEEHVNHAALFSRNIPLIENVAHLNELSGRRLKVCAFPIPIAGVESFPVRVVAFED